MLFALVTNIIAESEGFEPSIPLQIYTLSRRAPSTTRTTLLVSAITNRAAKIYIVAYRLNIFSALAEVICATSSKEIFFALAKLWAI